MKRIIITAAGVEAEAEFNDSATAEAIWEALPIEGSVNTWGEEIYFRIPVVLPLEADAREVVQAGDLGYWPQGQAFCIFFGPTPVSKAGEIRAASAVNLVGRVLEHPEELQAVSAGSPIRLERR